MNRREMLFAASAAAVPSIAHAQGQASPTPGDATLQRVTAVTMMAACIPCSNVESSIGFYTKGLGLTVAGRVEMGSVTEVPLMLPGGGAYLMLQHPKTAGVQLPTRGGLNRIVLNVPDLKGLESQLNAAGYKLKGKINEMAKYKVAVAHVEDPDGNHIELVQRT